jgi:DNA-binding MarR family transcriptional regulator
MNAKPKPPELLNALERGFRKMSTAGVMLHDTVTRQLGLSATDHKCMGLLCEHGPLSAGDIAQITGLTTGAVTGILDRLEQAEYVRRVRNPRDARSVIAKPINTAMFLERIGTLLEPLRQRMRSLVEGYSENELRLVLHFLDEAVRVSHAETLRLAQGSIGWPRYAPEEGHMSRSSVKGRRARSKMLRFSPITRR